MDTIAFVEQDCRVGFMRRNDTRVSLLKVLKRLNCTSAGITYIFCSDEYLLEINRNYLNHDTFTDVITFDYTLYGQKFPGEEIFRSFLPLEPKVQIEGEKKIKSEKEKKAVSNILYRKQTCLGSVSARKGTTAFRKEIIENPDEVMMTGIPGSPASVQKNPRPVSGDIYISIDRIKENAKMFHVKHIDELNRVMVHGLLHLAGYKDKTPAEEKKIHKKEDEMLATCFSGYQHLG